MRIFATPQVNSWGETVYQPTTAGFTVMILAMLGLVLLGCLLFGGKRRFSTRQLTFSAIAIALAMVTSMIEVIHMPMGGSVTLFSMLFIVLIGVWYGTGAGLTCAVAYGVLQMLVDPYILSIPQMLCDYIFAFGALGLSGIFHGRKNALFLGYITGILGRYFFTVLSGWIFFGSYAAGYGFESAVLYSLCYNGAYIGLEAAITLAVLSLPTVRRAMSHVADLARE